VSTKHIAIVTPGFAKDETETDCIPVLQHFVLELLNQGFLVTVFALHYPYRNETYMWNGIRVVALNGANSRFKREFTLYSQLKKAIKTLHQEHPISIIHSFWLNEVTYFSAKIARRIHIPIVATALGQDVLPQNRYLKKISAFKLPIYCLSDFHKSKLNPIDFPNTTIIHLGIKSSGERTKNIDVVGVGNLISLKNYTYFIRVCAELKAIRPDFTAVIVGDGPEFALLQALIQENQLVQNVQLKGQLCYSETLDYIGSARVLLHTSSFEGFGMIFAEALAQRTHVLSSPVGFAMTAPEITPLHFDPTIDAKELMKLIESPTPPLIFYSIASTVEQYKSVYAGL